MLRSSSPQEPKVAFFAYSNTFSANSVFRAGETFLQKQSSHIESRRIVKAFPYSSGVFLAFCVPEKRELSPSPSFF